MSLKNKALSGVIWTAINQFGMQIINFSVSILLTRLLLPAEFGLIAMIAIFFAIGRVLMDSGLGTSLIRSSHLTETDYSTVFFFNLIVSIVVYLIIFVSAPFIADFYEQALLTSIIRYYAVVIIIQAFSMVQISRLHKNLNFKTQTKAAIPSLLVGGLVGVLLAYLGYGVWSIVIMTILQASLNSILLWVVSSWKPSWDFDLKKFKHHINFGYKLTLSALIDTIYENLYIILIGKFFAPAQVGFYNRANTLQKLPVTSISSVINQVSFSLFSEMKDDNIRLKEAYQKIMKMVIFIIAPTLILMAVLAEPLFRFLFTEKWLPAVPYFQILCVNGILYPIHAYNLQILNVKGRSDLFLKLEIIKKVVITVVIVISFQYGIYGLLYGSVFSSLLLFFVNSHYSGKFLNYNAWAQTKDLLPSIILSLFIGGGVYWLDTFSHQLLNYDVLRLIIFSLAGALVYTFLAYVLKMDALNEILLIIKPKKKG